MPTRPPVFRPHHGRSKVERDREHDERRGSARERGYTPTWDRAAATFKADHPLCLGCAALGRSVLTAVVDHTIPHKGDPALFWDVANWQPACRWHHDVIKQQIEAMFARGQCLTSDLRLDSPLAIGLSRGRGRGA